MNNNLILNNFLILNNEFYVILTLIHSFSRFYLFHNVFYNSVLRNYYLLHVNFNIISKFLISSLSESKQARSSYSDFALLFLNWWNRLIAIWFTFLFILLFFIKIWMIISWLLFFPAIFFATLRSFSKTSYIKI